MRVNALSAWVSTTSVRNTLETLCIWITSIPSLQLPGALRARLEIAQAGNDDLLAGGDTGEDLHFAHTHRPQTRGTPPCHGALHDIDRAAGVDKCAAFHFHHVLARVHDDAHVHALVLTQPCRGAVHELQPPGHLVVLDLRGHRCDASCIGLPAIGDLAVHVRSNLGRVRLGHPKLDLQRRQIDHREQRGILGHRRLLIDCETADHPLHRRADAQLLDLAGQVGHDELLAVALQVLGALLEMQALGLELRVRARVIKRKLRALHVVARLRVVALGNDSVLASGLGSFEFALRRLDLHGRLVDVLLVLQLLPAILDVLAPQLDIQAVERRLLLVVLVDEGGAVESSEHLALRDAVAGAGDERDSAVCDGIQSGAVGGDDGAFRRDVPDEHAARDLGNPYPVARDTDAGGHPCPYRQNRCDECEDCDANEDDSLSVGSLGAIATSVADVSRIERWHETTPLRPRGFRPLVRSSAETCARSPLPEPLSAQD